MGKKLKLILFVLLPIICLVIAGIPFTLADYPETPIEQTMNGTSAEDTGASTADKSLKGGALYISNGASYTMTGGSITGKTNQYGGAVYVTNGSTFTMTGGTITGCSALYGGAIYVEAGGTCNITGGTITGNKAQFAPAIYVEDGATLNVDQTAVIKDNEYEKYGNPLEIYVDGSLVETRYIKADTYTINEDEMPLDYEHCCGYFLDEKLSQCSFGEVALTSEAMGFAPRTADAEEYVARLYTRTANPDNFSFTFNSTTQTYDIKAKGTTISGHIVLPKEYDNKQTSIYSTYNSSSGAFYNCSGVTGVTFQEGLTKISNWAFYRLSAMTEGLVIPDSVTSIGSSVFDGCTGMTGKLVIPSSVTMIGDYAFRFCRGFTGDLIIPDSVTIIDWSAFSGCSGFDGELVIGKGVTTIGTGAFYSCTGFVGSLTIPDNVTKIEAEAFYYCRGFTGDITIGNGVTSIGSNAFLECRNFVGELTLGNSVTTIENSAFKSCVGLKGDLIIPDSVTTIGDYAFQSCSGFTGDLVIGNGVTNIGVTSFNGCQKLSGTLTIGNSVKTIGNGAFLSCSRLTGNIVIPDSVESIGESAFDSCSGFNGSLTIGRGLTSIPTYAFYYCVKLTGDLVIPNSVESIGDKAFAYCTGITSIYIPASVETISANSNSNAPFFGFTRTAVLYCQPESKPDGWSEYFSHYDTNNQLTTIYGCSLDSDGNIVIPTNDINIYVDGATTPTKTLSFDYNVKSYTMVESDMPLQYENCCGYFLDEKLSKCVKGVIDLTGGDVNLYTKTASASNNFNFINNTTTGTYDIKPKTTSISGCIVMPKEYSGKQTSIAQSAFSGCSGLTGIVFQEGLTEIPDYTFARCYSFTCELIIPDTVTVIGEGAFTESGQFTGDLIIPDSVEMIKDGAFAYTSNRFGSLIIGDGVLSVGVSAFECCGFTGTLTLGNNIKTIADSAFFDNGFIGDLIIPDSVTDLGSSFGYNDFDGDLIIGDGVTEIKLGTFTNDRYFVGNLIIGNNVQIIHERVFYNINFTGGLIIPDSVTSIGNNAFEGCSGLTSVYMPSSVTTISASSYSSSPFYNCSSSLVIYTDVANASSKPSGWGTYWNYKSSSATYTTSYGYSLEQYKSAVGLEFAPIDGCFSGVDAEILEGVQTQKSFDSLEFADTKVTAVLNDNKKVVSLEKKKA